MSSKLEKDTYDLQFFKFTANQVTSERNHLMGIILNIVAKAIISKTSTPETIALLEEKKDEVVQRMRANMEQKLKELGDIDRKYFTIPEHVLLSNDYHMVYNYTESDEHEADEEYNQLKQRHIENSVKLTMLRMENEKFDKIKDFMQQEVEVQNQIENLEKTIDLEKLQLYGNKLLNESDLHKNLEI